MNPAGFFSDGTTRSLNADRNSNPAARASSRCRAALLLAGLAWVWAVAVSAQEGQAEVQRLAALTDNLQTFSANFEQTLYDEASEPLQHSTGQVVLQRPGRFYWRIAKPDDQEIIADGKRLWLHDVELRQVTVSPIDERVAGSPLLLLTSDTPLSEEFDITSIGRSEGLDWLQLLPRGGSSDFEAVYIGLDGESIAAMELKDSFGQATQIRFTGVQTNEAVDDALFEFTPPAGVDVIGDPEG